jgi:hypothetical protein
MPGIKDITHMTQPELGHILGISTRTIQRRADLENLRHGQGQGCYYVWSEVRGLMEGSVSQAGDLSDKERKEKADADMAEMDRDEQAGKLLQVSEWIRAESEFLGRLKGGFDGHGFRAAQEIAPGMVIAEMAEIIQADLDECLNGVVAREQALAAGRPV